MNRSYAMAVHPAVKPKWTYDSLFGGGPDAFGTKLIARGLEGVPARFTHRWSGEIPLFTDLQVDMGFTEAQARSIEGRPLVHVANDVGTAIAGFTYSAIVAVAGMPRQAGNRHPARRLPRPARSGCGRARAAR